MKNTKLVRTLWLSSCSLGDYRAMKVFWIIYAFSTLALLSFVYSILEVLPLCALVTVGAVASLVWLLWKRKALAKQTNLIPVAFDRVHFSVPLSVLVRGLGSCFFRSGFVHPWRRRAKPDRSRGWIELRHESCWLK